MAGWARALRLAETVRSDIPEIAADWLAPIAPDFESLTVEIEGETDEQFIARVQAFIEGIPNLYDKMDRKSLENSMYAANAEAVLLGIRGRINQANEIRARRKRRFNKSIGR